MGKATQLAGAARLTEEAAAEFGANLGRVVDDAAGVAGAAEAASGEARSFSLTDQILQPSCFVAGTKVLEESKDGRTVEVDIGRR